MIDQALLRDSMAAYVLDYTPAMGEQLDQYAQLLVEWNEKMNLTAITEPRDIVIKHFLDSLLLCKAVELPQGASMIDVGTGAGFPSVPVALYRPDLKLTLLDSLNKRITFLSAVCEAVSLPASCVHGRAEEMGSKPAYREQYDVACARAVAHLRELAEYCLPFVKQGGVFVALKGYEIEEELEEARYAIGQMGGEVADIQKYQLPDDNRRAIVVIKKVRQTPAKYPRPSAKIKKSPLNPKKQ